MKMENKSSSALGFTLVEVLIFLTVSLLLFGAAARTISGKQARTEFNTSVVNFESQLLDVANDVSTGFYSTNQDFPCRDQAGAVKFNGPDIDRGTKIGCILAGQAVVFDPAGANKNQMRIVALAGVRQKTVAGAVQEVGTIQEANPIPIDDTDQSTSQNIGQIEIRRVTYNNGGADITINALAFTTTFAKYAGSSLQSSDIRADLVPISAPGLFAGIYSTDGINDALTDPAAVINPSGGVSICVVGGVNQKATITLGGNGSQLTSKIVFGTAPCT